MKPLADMLPATARKWVYGLIGAAFTVESTLDAFDAGLVDSRPQGIAIAVLSALGFGMAFSKTRDLPPPPPPLNVD